MNIIIVRYESGQTCWFYTIKATVLISVDVFYPPGVADSAPSSQAGVFPAAVGAPADARAAADEPEGGLGRSGGANPAEPPGWSGGWLWGRGHR